MNKYYLLVVFREEDWEDYDVSSEIGVIYKFIIHEQSSRVCENSIDDVYVFLTVEQLKKKIDDLSSNSNEYDAYVKYILLRLCRKWEDLERE